MKAIYQCTCDSLIFGTCHCVGYSAGINTQTTEQVQGLVKRLVTRDGVRGDTRGIISSHHSATTPTSLRV
jgi:hypothetical protein